MRSFNSQKRVNKLGQFGCLIVSLLIILGVIGEGLCVYKAINSDWDPIGKGEIIYSGAFITGLGCVVGYLEIPD